MFACSCKNYQSSGSEHLKGEKLGVGSEVITRREAAAEFFQPRQSSYSHIISFDCFSRSVILVRYEPCSSESYLLPGMQAIV